MRTDRVLVLFNRTNSYEKFLQIPFRQCGFSCGWSTGAAERIGDRTRCTEKKVTVKFWAKINLVLTSDPTRLSIRAGTSSKCFSIRAGTSSKFSGFVGHWVLGLVGLCIMPKVAAKFIVIFVIKPWSRLGRWLIRLLAYVVWAHQWAQAYRVGPGLVPALLGA